MGIGWSNARIGIYTNVPERFTEGMVKDGGSAAAKGKPGNEAITSDSSHYPSGRVDGQLQYGFGPAGI
jgi:hypothetical protein